MTSFHSPLSAWFTGMPLHRWITKVDLGTQTFEGHLPPEAAQEILDHSKGMPVPSGRSDGGNNGPQDKAAPMPPPPLYVDPAVLKDSKGPQSGTPSWADLLRPRPVDERKYLFSPPFAPPGSMGHQPTFITIDQAKKWIEGDTPNLQDGLTPEAQLAGWWREKAEAEIGQTVAKAVEYGSTDLVDIGRDLARVADRELDDDEEAAEWGIYFYLLGKLSRWRSAMERGDRVSDDTLLDIGVYARMAQRVRESGGWPGIDKEDNE